MDIQSCIAGRGAGMVGNLVAYQNPASPTDERVRTFLREVKRDHLASEECGIDPSLRCRRRTASKDGVKLHIPAIEILACRDGIGCLAGRKQRHAGNENLMACFRFGSLGLLLCERCRREEKQRQEKRAINVQ